MEITERLIRRIARQEFGQMAKSGAYTRGSGGGGSYTLPVAADGTLGGIQIGYPTSAANRYYAVQLDSSHRAYVNVPWTDHYAWGDITGKPSFATVATSGSYNDLSNKPSIPSVSGSVSGSTLTITINGSSYSLTDTNTWRPVQNTLDSTSTSDSLSAYQGYLLARGDARDNTKLPLAGGAMNSGARISFSGGNGYLGNADNAGWLMVQDICSQNGAGDTYWSLRTNGNAHFANVYSAGYVTALSDARKKKVLGDVVLSAEQIAKMPAVRFEWKDNEKPGMFIGTLAQNWREILPEAVHTFDDGTLSFDYQSAAIVALINLADEIVAIKNKLKRYGFK